MRLQKITNNKPNLLFIIPNYSSQITGANKRAKNLVKCLSKNFKIFILTANTIITLSNNKIISKKKKNFLNQISLFFNNKFDYWFCDYINWSLIPVRGLIFTLHDMKEWTSYGRVGMFKKFLLFIISRKAKHLITVSEDQKKIIKENLKIDSHVSYNAVSNKWFEYQLKKKIKNKKNNNYIIYVSNFSKNKAHYNLLKNNPLLQKYKIIFVGSAIDKFGLSIRKNLQNYKNIKIYSNISELRLMKLVDNSLFAIFPSNYEGFGMPILEAISLKKKILISKSLKLKHFNNCSLVKRVDFKNGVKVKDINWAKSNHNGPIKGPKCLVRWEDVSNKMIKLLKL